MKIRLRLIRAGWFRYWRPLMVDDPRQIWVGPFSSFDEAVKWKF